MSEYVYTKSPISIDRLTQEIQQCAIVTALDYIAVNDSDVSIFFKAALSEGDQTILNDLVTQHNGEPLVETVIQEVVTQFEKDDKVLKLCGIKSSVGNDSKVTLLIKTPGIPGSGDGRFIAGGECWFSSATDGDKIEKVEVVDVDNLMGYGAGVVLRIWHDEDADLTEQGWYFPIHKPILAVEPIGGYGFIPSGLYLRVVAKKANDITTGTLYLNLFWAHGE